jgi:hypothetical protein
MILGMWLGASILANVFPVINMASVDRFVAEPGSAATTAQVRQTGAKAARFLLRRYASEQNAWVLTLWEGAEIALAIGLFCLVALGERPPRSAFVLIPAMLVIVLLELLILTPHLASAGRDVEEFQASKLLNDPSLSGFRAFQGIYAGAEFLKLLMGCGLAAQLMVRRDGSRSTAEQEPEHTSESERRSRTRRKYRTING